MPPKPQRSRSEPGSPSIARLLAGWAGWLLVLYGVWLVYVGTKAWLELVAGAVAVAIAAAAHQAVRRTGVGGQRLEPRSLALLVRLPWRIVEEFAVVMWTLVSAAASRERPHGRLRTLHADATGLTPTAAGRRVTITILGGVSPNTYVVDIDPESGAMVVHDLDTAHAKGRWVG